MFHRKLLRIPFDDNLNRKNLHIGPIVIPCCNFFFGFVRRHDRTHILPNILHAIGQTPLVKLNRIPQSEGIKCEVCK